MERGFIQMTSITDNITYLNLSKLNEFNQSLPNINITSFESIETGIINVFIQFPIIQWITSILIFIILFLVIRRLDFIDLTEIQIVSLISFVVTVFNLLLLLLGVYNITQPFQLFFVLWLVSTIASIAQKQR